jgi:DnaJ-class molecular chaperone
MEFQDCPKCLGTGETMEGKKKKKGFEYNICNLCKGRGKVPDEIAKDYVFSLNEDNFETNDDW